MNKLACWRDPGRLWLATTPEFDRVARFEKIRRMVEVAASGRT
jgi:hypothetical protein